jgi:protein RecA
MSILEDILGSTLGGNSELDGVEMWLDTGFKPLNHALSGSYNKGLPCGRIIELFGDESTGKTMIATSAMIAAQKAGGIAVFNDHERSFIPQLAERAGLDLTPGKYVYQTPRTFEQSITNTFKFITAVREKKAIPDESPILVVFDSLASMVPKSKLSKEIDEQGMNDSLALAKACSAVFPVMQLHASEFNVCILILNQQREKPGVMFGDATTTPGGKAPKFYSSIRVQLGRAMIKDAKDKSIVLGQEIKAKVVKNKVSRPYQRCEWRFMFREDGTGFLDAVGSTVDFCAENELIEKSGPRLMWGGKKYYRKALVDYINENNLKDELEALLVD